MQLSDRILVHVRRTRSAALWTPARSPRTRSDCSMIHVGSIWMRTGDRPSDKRRSTKEPLLRMAKRDSDIRPGQGLGHPGGSLPAGPDHRRTASCSCWDTTRSPCTAHMISGRPGFPDSGTGDSEDRSSAAHHLHWHFAGVPHEVLEHRRRGTDPGRRHCRHMLRPVCRHHLPEDARWLLVMMMACLP